MRFRRSLLVALACLAVGAPVALATPPDHAPAHGWRDRQDPVQPSDPPLTEREGLPGFAESLECGPLGGASTDPDVEPVLLVHGTGTTGPEEYAWNYADRLTAEGVPWCTITYPRRGSIDLTISAEYVAYGVQQLASRSASGKVDLVGHSQGAIMPRWAIRYWPATVQAALDDVVLHAGPHHGTTATDGFAPLVALGIGQPVPAWQMARGAEFVRRVNLGDETPGDADYTSIYAQTDELVQPSGPGSEATAWLDGALNVDVTTACPLRPIEHLTLGTSDLFVMDLTVRLLRDEGPHELTAGDLARCTAGGYGTLSGARAVRPGPLPDPSYLEPVPEEPAIPQYAIDQDARAGLG